MNSKIKLSFMITMILVSIISFSFAKELGLDNYIQNLDQNLKFTDTNINIKNVIDKYCSSILENNLKYDDSISYKANESAFVYIVCTNINKKYSDKFTDIKDYFTWTSFKNLGIKSLSPDGKINYCNPAASNMNDCDIPSQFSKIFKIIINEYTNIKQSSMYGITEKIDGSSKIEEFANKFGKNHFFTEICNSKKTWINYSKSCNIVKSYIQSSSRLLDNLTIIDKEELYKEKNNMIYNWVITHSDILFINFTNTLYNELFFLRIFVDYYSMIVSKDYNVLNSNSSEGVKQITKFNNEFSRIQKSISMTTRNLRDLYISFPLHIWLVMYYEDVLKLWKELAWISNPIYNLYDKFRNVQKPVVNK